MNKDDLISLAELSCLKLSESDTKSLLTDLEEMLIYMQLSSVDFPEESNRNIMILRDDVENTCEDMLEKGGEKFWIPKIL